MLAVCASICTHDTGIVYLIMPVRMILAGYCDNDTLRNSVCVPVSAGTGYQWGSHHWVHMTWNKVYVARLLYAMGFTLLHADADTTWYSDPYPWLQQVGATLPP